MKNWVQLLLCLLLSASIWLIHNLSQTYVDIVSMPVIAHGNIEGRAGKSSTEATVTAQVKASGFRHASLSRSRKKAVVVDFSSSDLKHVDGDVYSVPVSALYKYSSEIFGEASSIESVISEAPVFTFPLVSHKRVPIRQVQSISFEPQYMALKSMSLTPDSVTVYGEPFRLENVDYVLTRPIVLKDLDGSAHGTVRLETPSGVRLSAVESVYDLEVSRYVEIRSEVRIETRNVPAGLDLSILPSSAVVLFRCIFPTKSDPASKARFYIDYRDFANSISGRCIVRCENLPSDVIDYTVTPEVFDCIEKDAE